MILHDFIRFLACPTPVAGKISIRKKTIYFVVLLFCSIILVYGLTIILQMFIDQPADKVNELSFLKLIAFGLLLAPVFEELVFRLSLIYSKLNFSISLCLAQTALITTILDIRLLTWFGGTTFIVSFFAFYIFLNNHKIAHQLLHNFWKTRFIWIFYFCALFFSLFHITNYEFYNLTEFLIAFLFSVPRLLGALVLGFVRIRLGFLWAVLMHILFNAVPFGLMITLGCV